MYSTTWYVMIDDVSLEHLGHSHVTYAVVDKSCDGTYSLRCLKQKQFVDGVGYLLQEIYGIENKNTERAKVLHCYCNIFWFVYILIVCDL